MMRSRDVPDVAAATSFISFERRSTTVVKLRQRFRILSCSLTRLASGIARNPIAQEICSVMDHFPDQLCLLHARRLSTSPLYSLRCDDVMAGSMASRVWSKYVKPSPSPHRLAERARLTHSVPHLTGLARGVLMGLRDPGWRQGIPTKSEFGHAVPVQAPEAVTAFEPLPPDADDLVALNHREIACCSLSDHNMQSVAPYRSAQGQSALRSRYRQVPVFGSATIRCTDLSATGDNELFPTVIWRTTLSAFPRPQAQTCE